MTDKAPRNFEQFDLKQLEQLVENYNRRGEVHGADFAALLREREAKRADLQEPDLYKSLELLKARAREGRFVSYGELAGASGLTWTHTLRARMSGPKSHLDRLLDLCNSQRLPLLTAICVNKGNLATGDLEEFALAGFVAGAKRLHRQVGEEQAFLRQCQEECFSWGRAQGAHSGATGRQVPVVP